MFYFQHVSIMISNMLIINVKKNEYNWYRRFKGQGEGCPQTHRSTQQDLIPVGGIGWRAWREINQVQVNTGSREVFVYPDRNHGLGIPGKLTAKFVPANWIS